MSGTEQETYLRTEYRKRAEWHVSNAVDALHEDGDVVTAVRNFDAAALNYKLAGMPRKYDDCRDRAETLHLALLEADTIFNPYL